MVLQRLHERPVQRARHLAILFGVTSDMIGVLQRCLEAVNRVGWAIVGTKWPLFTSHIFVFRKVAELAAEMDSIEAKPAEPRPKVEFEE